MNKCKGIFGFLFGHKLEDKYDTKYDPVDPEVAIRVTAESMVFAEQNIAAAQGMTETYVKSVCPRCGFTVRRNYFSSHFEEEKGEV